MISWIYKWLPIIFGCHCRDDRSFHYHGRKFPICARCTGELIGIIIAAVLAFFRLPPAWCAALLLVPLIADGLAQLLTVYESTNIRRMVTGILFGYGLFSLFLISYIATVRFGYRLGRKWS